MLFPSVKLPDSAPFSAVQREWLGEWLTLTLAPGGMRPLVAQSSIPETAESSYSKKTPFPAEVLASRNLNGSGEKQTHHVAFSLAGSGLSYSAGDALGVYPENPAEVVDEILANLQFSPNEVVDLAGGKISLREALTRYYDIGALNRGLVQRWQPFSESPFLRSLVEADQAAEWDAFCRGRELIDLVLDHPAEFAGAEAFCSILKKLQPRLYSIASSQKAHPEEVQLCVGIVRYETHGRKRGGTCSTFLADRLGGGAKPRVFVHSNSSFRLPADNDVPVIMVGPGTGIAPFRAFLEERRATGAKGGNWLFFGNPHQTSDYLYQNEIAGFLADGTLGKLDLAWSRDQAE